MKQSEGRSSRAINKTETFISLDLKGFLFQ
jgi:hypothetical protein